MYTNLFFIEETIIRTQDGRDERERRERVRREQGRE